MSKELSKIQKMLQQKADEKTKESIQRLIPSPQKVYGVKTLELNRLALKYKNVEFDLIEELWKAGAFEEKLLAAKIMGKICKRNPKKTIKLIKKFAKEIADWAVCDTLATQAIKGITKIKQKEIVENVEKDENIMLKKQKDNRLKYNFKSTSF